MESIEEKIRNLSIKIDLLLAENQLNTAEIFALKKELENIKSYEQEVNVSNLEPEEINELIANSEKIESEVFDDSSIPIEPKIEANAETPNNQTPITPPPIRQQFTPKNDKPSVSVFDLEKYIGENLLNKVGILITIIGIGVGTKYAIDNDLINPLTRIVLGYLAGLILLVFSFKLRDKYLNYSAVLLSGSMASFYLITFFAYDFYGMMPQIVAFVLMVIFTVFTVLASVSYNMQVIAHIGLVGAYTVPFLLSDGSGRADILFGYTSIINIGILFLAFKKYWKPLNFTSFGLTWLIFFSWYASSYSTDKHFILALSFAFIFFVIFLTNYIIHSIKFNKVIFDDVFLLVLLNALIFYFVGCNILETHKIAKDYTGLFTLCNALIYLITAFYLKNKLDQNKNIFFLSLGLTLFFVTLFIPEQFNGEVVSVSWACLAAIVLWIGLNHKVNLYIKSSSLIYLISFISLVQDLYSVNYDLEFTNSNIAFLNVYFLEYLIYLAATAFMIYTNNKAKEDGIIITSKYYNQQTFQNFLIFALIFACYFTFSTQISIFWVDLLLNSKIELSSAIPKIQYNQAYNHYSNISLVIYTFSYFALLTYLKRVKFESIKTFNFLVIANSVVIYFGVMIGLLAVSYLNYLYFDLKSESIFDISFMAIVVRYLFYFAAGILLMQNYKLNINQDKNKPIVVYNHTLVVLIILIFSSAELLLWSNAFHLEQMHKLGLSILWGVLSMLIVIRGINKNNKAIRVIAIVLFGITLMKVFFFDMEHISTIYKTILFITIGVILLATSFLYNKYTARIFNSQINTDKNEKEEGNLDA